MQFQPFSFQKPDGRPFFFTSFVSTIDGKIIVKEKGYWPIGTKEDYNYFTYLRAHADAIVDAKNTAVMFGKYTIKTLHSEIFQEFRKELGKEGLPEYIVLKSNPDEALTEALENEHGFETKILTVENAELSSEIEKVSNVVRCHPEAQPKDPVNNQVDLDSSHSLRMTNKRKRVSVQNLVDYLNSREYKNVFIDGGPTLVAQLLQEEVLDEVHLTIAPKIFGSLPGKTLTMVEGMLFPPEEIPQFNLTSVDRIGDDEVVLRYQR